jgi:endonuclease/exonuclease/phosphatase family metal-dependent hydrolase
MVALAATASLVFPATTAVPAWAASYATPSGLKAAKVSANSIALTWKKVKNAPAYRVSFSTKKSMSGAKTIDVVSNYLEWSRLDPNRVYASPRLRPSTTYYFRVKVIGLNQASLSKYSKVVKVKTASAKSYPELAPVGLKATARSTTSMYLSWSSRGPGVRYKIVYNTDPALPYGTSKVVSSNHSERTLTGLTPGTTYYYKVKVINQTGAELSAYSAVGKLRPPTTAVSPPITVATYNVCSYVCGGSWSTRLPAIIDNLKAQDPDIVAVQEISTSPLGTLLSSWNSAVADATGDGRDYQTTDTPNRSVSGSTRLVYDANRFDLGEHGVQALPADTDTKYAVWAVLTDTRSGKRVFAVATHLTVGSGDSYAERRRLQTQAIVDLVNANNLDQLPVVIAGDFNSGKAYKPSNVIYGVLTAAGYKDPLGNTDNSWAIDPSATAEHRVDLEFNSFNGFVPQAKVAKYSNGYDVDYIWHSPTVRVAVSQLVVNLDTSGKFVGTIPSDHNMLVAIIHLK